ncbi:MAG TPA: DsbA family protein [Acidimicrobiales bacterium]|nr:DsbA family protein [Acidimicrobiales bacterium]
MTRSSFAITWDYRCPYARNAHEHVVAGLLAGAPWDVQFVPFNLDQPHVREGEAPVWEEPDRYPGLLATAAGVVVRDRFPDRFLAVHQALFAARHDRSLDLRRRDVLADALTAAGVDAAAVLADLDDGWPLETFRKEHESAVAEHDVFGVPTFIAGGRAVFVRLLSRPDGDGDLAISTIQRVIDLTTGWADLNEFKQTVVPR